MPDYVNMFLEIPPKLSVSSFMRYLKGKSSDIIYQKLEDMKYKYRNRSFQCRGYYVGIVGKNAVVIARYIDEQLKEDKSLEQLTLDKIDQFTGNKRKWQTVLVFLSKAKTKVFIGVKEKPLVLLVDSFFEQLTKTTQ